MTTILIFFFFYFFSFLKFDFIFFLFRIFFETIFVLTIHFRRSFTLPPPLYCLHIFSHLCTRKIKTPTNIRINCSSKRTYQTAINQTANKLYIFTFCWLMQRRCQGDAKSLNRMKKLRKFLFLRKITILAKSISFAWIINFYLLHKIKTK